MRHISLAVVLYCPFGLAANDWRFADPNSQLISGSSVSPTSSNVVANFFLSRWAPLSRLPSTFLPLLANVQTITLSLNSRKRPFIIRRTVSGTADVTLRIYAVDSLNDLGSLLLTSTLTGVSFAADSSTPLTFSGLSTIVPANVVWTLSYATTDSIALEFPDYDPPTVGSSDNTTVWWDTGSGLTLTSPGFNTENYYFELSGDTAAEPGSFLLAVLGLTDFAR